MGRNVTPIQAKHTFRCIFSDSTDSQPATRLGVLGRMGRFPPPQIITPKPSAWAFGITPSSLRALPPNGPLPSSGTNPSFFNSLGRWRRWAWICPACANRCGVDKAGMRVGRHQYQTIVFQGAVRPSFESIYANTVSHQSTKVHLCLIFRLNTLCDTRPHFFDGQELIMGECYLYLATRKT